MSKRAIYSYNRNYCAAWIINNTYKRNHNMPYRVAKVPQSLQLYFDREKGQHLYLPCEIGTRRVTFTVNKLRKRYGLIARDIYHLRIDQNGN